MTQKPIKDKIFFLDDLVRRVERFKRAGKVVVQSHGVFDILHPGMLQHLNSAKEQGDVLIVTVIRDRDVKKGPGRPIFPENLRAENAASLSIVDYVSVVDDEIPFQCVKAIKPDIFAKGQAYKDRDSVVHKRIFDEEKEIYFGKSKICETKGFSFSSSALIKDFSNIYAEDVKMFLERFRRKYAFKDIAKRIDGLKGLRVLLIGDGIVDEYHYCTPLGKSAKAHLVVNKHLSHETFAGGVFAIANHIAGLCDNVRLISLLGNGDSKEDFIRNNLKPNVDAKFFHRDDGPTIVKKRYIDQYLNQKLFEVNYLNDNYIEERLEAEIVKCLKKKLPSYDIVLVSDFGHGFISKNVISAIKKFSAGFAVNTQTNGANAGYNMITKYQGPAYVCLDEPEVRLSAQDRYGDIEAIAKETACAVKSDYFIVTRGKHGSMGIDTRKGEVNATPAFSTKVIDTVGAGDAFFAYTAPCIARGMPLDMVSFIGNAVGALAVQIVCNKRPVEKRELLDFIHTLLK